MRAGRGGWDFHRAPPGRPWGLLGPHPGARWAPRVEAGPSVVLGVKSWLCLRIQDGHQLLDQRSACREEAMAD